MVETEMVFAIIITAIVIGFLLAAGLGQIQSFFCLGSDAQTLKAVKDVEAIVEEVSFLAKGSAKTYTLALPGDAKVCFVNKNNPGPYPHPDPERTWDPGSLILDNFLRNPASPSFGSNLWVHSCSKPLGEGYKMKYLSPTQSFCARRGHELLMENKGQSIDISIR